MSIKNVIKFYCADLITLLNLIEMVGYSNFPKDTSDTLETSSIPNDFDGINSCPKMDNISDKVSGPIVLTISGEVEKRKDVEQGKS